MQVGAASKSASAKSPARREQRFRALRHAVSEFAVGSLSASAWHPRLHALSAQCENVSLHGLLLRLPGRAGDAGLLHPDDLLSGLHVTLPSGEVAFHGEAVVRHCSPDGIDLLCGVALREGGLDLELLHQGHARRHIVIRCDEAERAADSACVRPAFKEWVADLRTYLETMKAFLAREEEALAGEDRYTREQICAQYLEEVGPRIIERMHRASQALGAVIGDLDPEGHAVHRAYAQQHLSPLFATSPFMRRALEKPLGYAGDYEMMDMLYRPHAEGDSLFGQIINQWATSLSAARANINRIGFLTERLRATILARREERARAQARVMVASIGCGPAREVELLLTRHPELGEYLDVMLVDQDVRAIAFCERRLSRLAGQTGVRLHYIRESVRRLLTGGSLAAMLGPRDLIYSAGLFDYLSKRSFSTLLSALYDALVPGGSLLVGNVDQHNPSRYCMEYFAEWYLVHRSPEELLELARPIQPPPRGCRVESEPLGVNLFLVLER
jgi:extracellular factor (EF) 3-hydroxypalmitic acid methyl ester biosynthesis protein